MKKQHIAILSSTFLLVLFLITQSVFATSVDSSSGTSTTSSKYIDVAGSCLSTSDANKVQNFLNSIKKTEGFVVYANNIDRTNHIEGNVCVSSVTTSSNFVLTRVGEKKTGDYSYVGSSTSSIQLSDNEKIVVGSEISVSKPNENQTIINRGYSNNIVVEQLSTENTLAKNNEISATLGQIAQAGNALKNNVDSSFYGDSRNSFESINSMFENKILNSGDVVVINVDYKQLLNNEGAFGNLINNNSGTRVVVNVIFSDSGVDNINISKCFSANTQIRTEFNNISSYIVWNFGDYSGNITFSEEMCGIVVAPNATVYQAAGNLNGQFISNVAGNNGELHQVTVTPNVPSVPTEPLEEPEQPIEPETPEIPDVPKIPEKPIVPETPNISKITENQETPTLTKTTVNTPKVVEKPIAPKTGDNTSILVNLLVVLSCLAVTIITILCFRKRK